MRIVIDAFQAAPAITGTDRVAYNVLRELQDLDSTNDYTVITNAEHPYIAGAVTASNFTVLPIRAKKRLIWLNLRLPGLLRRLRAEAFYSFHNIAGPSVKTCRTVCTLLDVIPITDPDLYHGKASFLKRYAVTASMKRAARQADAFVAISQYTKDTAVAALGIAPDSISVIPLQADPSFFAAASEKQLADVAAKYALPNSFVFALGSSDPRKNVAELLLAHRALPAKLRSKYPLLIGGARWHNEQVALDGDAHARLLGFIADEDLPLVFRLATIFVFPSLFEGFGLTVLEAMASGTPVITSNTTSIPEAAGDAAMLVDPTSRTQITQAMHTLLQNEGMQRQLAKAGTKQVQKFSWKRAATIIHGLVTS